MAPVPLRVTGRASSRQTGADAGVVAGKAASSFATSAGIAFAKGTVAAAASGSLATSVVPVAGWIAAAVGAAVSGIVALVSAVIQAKIRREEAVAWAMELGIPDAGQFPAFIVDVQRMGFHERYQTAAKLTRQIAAARGKRRETLVYKRAIIGVLMQLEAQQKIGQAPPPAPTYVLVRKYGLPPSTWLPWAVGGTMVASAAVILLSRRG